MDWFYCKNCGLEFSSLVSRCNNCGAEIAKCPNCGAVIDHSGYEHECSESDDYFALQRDCCYKCKHFYCVFRNILTGECSGYCEKHGKWVQYNDYCEDFELVQLYRDGGIIESLDQLEVFAQNNARLKGLINRLKYGIRLDDKILALASILRTLQRKRIAYSEHFVRHCLLYICSEEVEK